MFGNVSFIDDSTNNLKKNVYCLFHFLNNVNHNHTFKSDIIFRKSVREPYVSKSSKCRRCGTIFCGLGIDNGTGSNSGITE